MDWRTLNVMWQCGWSSRKMPKKVWHCCAFDWFLPHVFDPFRRRAFHRLDSQIFGSSILLVNFHKQTSNSFGQDSFFYVHTQNKCHNHTSFKNYSSRSFLKEQSQTGSKQRVGYFFFQSAITSYNVRSCGYGKCTFFCLLSLAQSNGKNPISKCWIWFAWFALVGIFI